MKFLREIVVVGALLAGASAQAAPKNIDDCEKIKEPMAYNECLASFGPAVGHVGAGQSYGPASEGEPRAAAKGPKGERLPRAGAARGKGDGDAWGQWAGAHGVHAEAKVRGGARLLGRFQPSRGFPLRPLLCKGHLLPQAGEGSAPPKPPRAQNRRHHALFVNFSPWQTPRGSLDRPLRGPPAMAAPFLSFELPFDSRAKTLEGKRWTGRRTLRVEP